MPPLIYTTLALLLFCIIKVQSSYSVYTFNDGDNDDDDESCCLVRIGEKFCLATPLTRSLVQVRKECQRLGANEKKKNYLNRIVRRLNVESSVKIGEKILIQLQNPLEKDLLENDLLCLSAADNNIDLEKCYVELTKKGTSTNTTNDEDQLQRVEIIEPVRIRKGHGLSIRQTFELNVTDFQATTRQERECWSWYRKHTKDILSHPTKSKKSCVPLNKQEETCLEKLFYRKSKTNENKSIPIGSKLYCENNLQQDKLLGYHRQSELCFLTHYQVYLNHKFTDFVSLSDSKKNKDVLKYLANNTKLTKEFEGDCGDKQTLAEIKKALEEKARAKLIAVDENASTKE